MTQSDFDAAVSAELVRLTLGGKPDRPELQVRCELSDLLIDQCSPHCTQGERNLGPASGGLYEDEENE